MKLRSLAMLCLFGTGAVNSVSAQEVTITEKPLIIPTYQIGPADPNPIFFTGRTYQGAAGHIYPYPMFDKLTDKRADKSYDAIYLENEFTQFCVLPELGGRIFSALDKTDNYDFFYRQHVIKPTLIGMTGAWISGGVEWNVPHHHRASSFMPVDYRLVENRDGSKTVWVGETEWREGLKWSVGLSLYPGRSYIEATVRISNYTPFSRSFLYWANVAVQANDAYRVLFPPTTQFGAQHAKVEFTSWPIGSGMYNDADRTGIDLSWWKNHPTPASIFAWHSAEDFIGGYDYGKDAGTMHIANHQVVEGKKFFLFSKGTEGQMWDKMLTDHDGPYLELMVGAYSDNQPDYSWIDPGETREFKQYWYPIRNTGGAVNANTDAAVNMERISPAKVKFAINSTGLFENATVLLTDKQKVLFKKVIRIDPGHPFTDQVSVAPGLPDTALTLSLTAAGGRELIRYTPVNARIQPPPKPVDVPRPPKDYVSTEEVYLTGLRLQQFHNASISPLPYYEEVLRRDSLDYRTNTRLGMIYSMQGDFVRASAYLEKAISRLTKDYTAPKDGEAFYYLGVVHRFLGDTARSTDAFWKATWYAEYRMPAYYALARLACAEKKYDQALDLVEAALQNNSRHAGALTLKAFILRKLGRTEEALTLASKIRAMDPLDNWGAAEVLFSPLSAGGERRLEAYKKSLAGKDQDVLNVVVNYCAAGAYAEALDLLEWFVSGDENPALSPLLFYYAGYCCMKQGLTEKAHNFFSRAEKQPGTYCFPFRLESIAVLESATDANPRGARGYYYLGELYYYLEQHEKGIAAWEKSAALDKSFCTVFRNLGFAYASKKNDLDHAVKAYETAIAINDKDPRLFYELDKLYEDIQKPVADRLAFLEQHEQTISGDDNAMLREVILYTQTGQYQQALDIMTHRHFREWEGSGVFHSAFTDAALLDGISKMGKKEYAKALAAFQQAGLFPDNLELGKPYRDPAQVRVDYYRALASEALKDKRKALSYYTAAANGADGMDPEFRYYRAMAMKKLNRQPEAAAMFDDMIASAKEQLSLPEGVGYFSKFGDGEKKTVHEARAHYALGLAFMGKGDQEAAHAEFNKSLALAPDQVWASYFLHAGNPG